MKINLKANYTIMDYNDGITIIDKIVGSHGSIVGYNATSDTYNPEWNGETPLVLTPHSYKLGEDSTDIISSSYNQLWSYKINDGDWINITGEDSNFIIDGTTITGEEEEEIDNSNSTFSLTFSGGTSFFFKEAPYNLSFKFSYSYYDEKLNISTDREIEKEFARIENGESPIFARAWSEDGETFKNNQEPSEIILRAELVRGSTNDTTQLSWEWQKKENGVWEKKSVSLTNSTITIVPDDITGYGQYRCIITDTAMSDTSGNYDYISNAINIIDLTDPYSAVISSSTGTVMINGEVDAELLCTVYQNKNVVEDGIEYTWTGLKEDGTTAIEIENPNSQSIYIDSTSIPDDKKATFTCNINKVGETVPCTSSSITITKSYEAKSTFSRYGTSSSASIIPLEGTYVQDPPEPTPGIYIWKEEGQGLTYDTVEKWGNPVCQTGLSASNMIVEYAINDDWTTPPISDNDFYYIDNQIFYHESAIEESRWTTELPNLDNLNENQYVWERRVSSGSSDWTVIRITGLKGKSSYIHIGYSAYDDGINPNGEADFFSTPSDSTKYLGFYSSESSTDSTDANDYVWSLYKGADGSIGTDGKSSYLHMAYSTSADGKDNFSTTNFVGATYWGVYSDELKEGNEEDSNNYLSYSWLKISASDPNYYEGEWNINSEETGWDFEFPPVNSEMNLFAVKIYQSDLEGNVEVLFNENNLGIMNGTDGISEWKDFDVLPSYINVDKDNIVRIQLIDNSVVDEGKIYKVYFIYSKAGKDGEDGEDAISCQIYSKNGTVFRDMTANTVLSCIVFKGTENITDTLDESLFTWTRKSSGTDLEDEIWNNSSKAMGKKTVTLTPDDVIKRSVFSCEVDI